MCIMHAMLYRSPGMHMPPSNGDQTIQNNGGGFKSKRIIPVA